MDPRRVGGKAVTRTSDEATSVSKRRRLSLSLPQLQPQIRPTTPGAFSLAAQQDPVFQVPRILFNLEGVKIEERESLITEYRRRVLEAKTVDDLNKLPYANPNEFKKAYGFLQRHVTNRELLYASTGRLNQSGRAPTTNQPNPQLATSNSRLLRERQSQMDLDSGPGSSGGMFFRRTPQSQTMSGGRGRGGKGNQDNIKSGPPPSKPGSSGNQNRPPSAGSSGKPESHPPTKPAPPAKETTVDKKLVGEVNCDDEYKAKNLSSDTIAHIRANLNRSHWDLSIRTALMELKEDADKWRLFPRYLKMRLVDINVPVFLQEYGPTKRPVSVKSKTHAVSEISAFLTFYLEGKNDLVNSVERYTGRMSKLDRVMLRMELCSAEILVKDFNSWYTRSRDMNRMFENQLTWDDGFIIPVTGETVKIFSDTVCGPLSASLGYFHSHVNDSYNEVMEHPLHYEKPDRFRLAKEHWYNQRAVRDNILMILIHGAPTPGFDLANLRTLGDVYAEYVGIQPEQLSQEMDLDEVQRIRAFQFTDFLVTTLALLPGVLKNGYNAFRRYARITTLPIPLPDTRDYIRENLVRLDDYTTAGRGHIQSEYAASQEGADPYDVAMRNFAIRSVRLNTLCDTPAAMMAVCGNKAGRVHLHVGVEYGPLRSMIKSFIQDTFLGMPIDIEGLFEMRATGGGIPIPRLETAIDNMGYPGPVYPEIENLSMFVPWAVAPSMLAVPALETTMLWKSMDTAIVRILYPHYMEAVKLQLYEDGARLAMNKIERKFSALVNQPSFFRDDDPRSVPARKYSQVYIAEYDAKPNPNDTIIGVTSFTALAHSIPEFGESVVSSGLLSTNIVYCDPDPVPGATATSRAAQRRLFRGGREHVQRFTQKSADILAAFKKWRIATMDYGRFVLLARCPNAIPVAIRLAELADSQMPVTNARVLSRAPFPLDRDLFTACVTQLRKTKNMMPRSVPSNLKTAWEVAMVIYFYKPLLFGLLAGDLNQDMKLTCPILKTLKMFIGQRLLIKTPYEACLQLRLRAVIGLYCMDHVIDASRIAQAPSVYGQMLYGLPSVGNLLYAKIISPQVFPLRPGGQLPSKQWLQKLLHCYFSEEVIRDVGQGLIGGSTETNPFGRSPLDPHQQERLCSLFLAASPPPKTLKMLHKILADNHSVESIRAFLSGISNAEDQVDDIIGGRDGIRTIAGYWEGPSPKRASLSALRSPFSAQWAGNNDSTANAMETKLLRHFVDVGMEYALYRFIIGSFNWDYGRIDLWHVFVTFGQDRNHYVFCRALGYTTQSESMDQRYWNEGIIAQTYIYTKIDTILWGFGLDLVTAINTRQGVQQHEVRGVLKTGCITLIDRRHFPTVAVNGQPLRIPPVVYPAPSAPDETVATTREFTRRLGTTNFAISRYRPSVIERDMLTHFPPEPVAGTSLVNQMTNTPRHVAYDSISEYNRNFHQRVMRHDDFPLHFEGQPFMDLEGTVQVVNMDAAEAIASPEQPDGPEDEAQIDEDAPEVPMDEHEEGMEVSDGDDW